MNEFEQYTEDLGIITQRESAMACGRVTVLAFPVFCFGFIQGVRFGFLSGDYIILILGSLTIPLLCFSYLLPSVLNAYGRPVRWWYALASASLFVPYFFVCYLTFFRGIWSLIKLFSVFSLSSLSSGVVFLILGVFLMKHLQQVTDVARISDNIAKRFPINK